MAATGREKMPKFGCVIRWTNGWSLSLQMFRASSSFCVADNCCLRNAFFLIRFLLNDGLYPNTFQTFSHKVSQVETKTEAEN